MENSVVQKRGHWSGHGLKFFHQPSFEQRTRWSQLTSHAWLRHCWHHHVTSHWKNNQQKCETAGKQKTRDWATKAKVLRCRHRCAPRGRGVTCQRGGWHFPVVMTCDVTSDGGGGGGWQAGAKKTKGSRHFWNTVCSNTTSRLFKGSEVMNRRRDFRPRSGSLYGQRSDLLPPAGCIPWTGTIM